MWRAIMSIVEGYHDVRGGLFCGGCGVMWRAILSNLAGAE